MESLTARPARRRVIGGREIAIATAVGALVVVAVWTLAFKPRSMPDFQVYWRAGGRAAAAAPLYRPEDADYQFKYFPAFAVLAAPLGALPLDVARALWLSVSILCLVFLLSTTPTLPVDRCRSTALIAGWMVLALGKYFVRDVVLGQINVLFVAIVVCALLAMRAGRDLLAGGLVALAVAVKPYALILVPWMAARRARPSTLAMAAGLAAVGALPMLIYGVSGDVALHQAGGAP